MIFQFISERYKAILETLLKKWTMAARNMATLTSKNKAIIGIMIVPTPKPVKRVTTEVPRVIKMSRKY
jgi:hypothetical protein